MVYCVYLLKRRDLGVLCLMNTTVCLDALGVTQKVTVLQGVINLISTIFVHLIINIAVFIGVTKNRYLQVQVHSYVATAAIAAVARI